MSIINKGENGLGGAEDLKKIVTDAAAQISQEAGRLVGEAETAAENAESAGRGRGSVLKKLSEE